MLKKFTLSIFAKITIFFQSYFLLFLVKNGKPSFCTKSPIKNDDYSAFYQTSTGMKIFFVYFAQQAQKTPLFYTIALFSIWQK